LSDVSAPGTCTLRDAINTAQGSPVASSSCGSSGATEYAIGFKSGLTGTIILGSSLPAITGEISITGPTSSPGLTIDGNHAVRVMALQSSAKLELKYLTIADGSTANSGGGIENSGGSLSVSNCLFKGNHANNGGAIDNFGTTAIINSTLSGNSSTLV